MTPLVLLLVLFLNALAQSPLELEVKTQHGVLRGRLMTSRSGRTFRAFLKVPYASPPIGDLRFEPPQELSSWPGVLDATKDGIICTQRNVYVKTRFYISGQEDCLYLNVYTPRLSSTASQHGLPVMVFFHGGGWVTGSGNSDYYPPGYLLDKDVVYVAVNYRLGPLGFLGMEDERLPGNWGLKDQSFALRWVKNNIRAFGGDPDTVTIFGESAGGSSVHYHMVSPMSRGLFHRGISQSGTAFTSWSLAQPGATRNNTLKMAELLGCPTRSTEALVSCLKAKPAADIITQDIQFMEWFRDPMIPFKPVVESLAAPGEAFLPQHPEEVILTGGVAPVPWMTGLNSGDGALRVAGIYDDDKLVQELDRNFEQIVPMSLFYRGRVAEEDESAVTRRLRDFYLGGHKVDNHTIEKMVDLWTDGWFLSGADHAVHLMRKHSPAPVYYYYFSYRGTHSFSSVFGDGTRDYGVCHADELIYLFPFEAYFTEKGYTEDDKHYIEVLVQLWTDFARTGNPTPTTTKLVPVKWQPVTSHNLEYLHLGAGTITMETNLLEERSSLWSSLRAAGAAVRASLLRDEL